MLLSAASPLPAAVLPLAAALRSAALRGDAAQLAADSLLAVQMFAALPAAPSSVAAQALAVAQVAAAATVTRAGIGTDSKQNYGWVAPEAVQWTLAGVVAAAAAPAQQQGNAACGVAPTAPAAGCAADFEHAHFGPAAVRRCSVPAVAVLPLVECAAVHAAAAPAAGRAAVWAAVQAAEQAAVQVAELARGLAADSQQLLEPQQCLMQAVQRASEWLRAYT